MCGIGGILGGGLRASERESAALRLQAALAHRGPDGAGSFLDGECVLVHTRLAILDPTAVGHQPMTRGPLTVTFNGEIYDFRARREELLRQGERFTTQTDTEVLLALHAQHGLEGLDNLRGMFAYALWDAPNSTCLLTRDPFGIKPLYCAPFGRGGLVFASEVRAILATGLIPRHLDSAALNGFLATGSVPEPHTLVAGIHCLEAGHSLRWTPEGFTIRPSSEIKFDSSTNGSSAPDFRTPLADSVQQHLVSDVPVGLLLSGGLDSSALLALIKTAGRDDVATFSLGVEDATLDEAGAARVIARHFGVKHHEMLLTQEMARHWIGDFLDAIDQPTLDGFNTYCACKLASDHECKVVLSGLGADELLGGYPSFHQIPRLLAAARSFPIPASARALERLPLTGRVSRICDFLGGTPTPGRAYGTVRGVFTDFEIGRLRSTLFPSLAPSPSPASEKASDASLPEEISRLELTRYLRNQLLRDADVMSMVHGVEIRVPFLDLPLFENLRAIPVSQRFGMHKQLLRRAVPELPVGLLAPRKRAFGLPFSGWLENEWADLARHLPPLPRVSLTPWYRRWSLIVLMRWIRHHGLTAA